MTISLSERYNRLLKAQAEFNKLDKKLVLCLHDYSFAATDAERREAYQRYLIAKLDRDVAWNAKIAAGDLLVNDEPPYVKRTTISLKNVVLEIDRGKFEIDRDKYVFLNRVLKNCAEPSYVTGDATLLYITAPPAVIRVIRNQWPENIANEVTTGGIEESLKATHKIHVEYLKDMDHPLNTSTHAWGNSNQTRPARAEDEKPTETTAIGELLGASMMSET